jgi:hypothetical protein
MHHSLNNLSLKFVFVGYPSNDDDDHGGLAHEIATDVSIAFLVAIGVGFTAWWLKQYFDQQKKMEALLAK